VKCMKIFFHCEVFSVTRRCISGLIFSLIVYLYATGSVSHIIFQEVYRPQRHFRRKDAPPEEEESRVQSTLLEYGYKQIVATPVLSAESVSCVQCQYLATGRLITGV
jgi:hypothetical protein